MKLNLKLLISGVVSVLAFTGESGSPKMNFFTMADHRALASKMELVVGSPIPVYSGGPVENGNWVYSDQDNKVYHGTDSLILQPVARKEDQNSANPNTLPLFHMLVAYGKTNFLKMLDVAPLDDALITVITGRDHPFVTDRHTVFQQAQSDAADNQLGGYWLEPWTNKEAGVVSGAFYYYCGSEATMPLVTAADRVADTDSWVEICEGGVAGATTMGAACGLERVQFAATYCKPGVVAPRGVERKRILTGYSEQLKHMLSAEYPGLYDL